MIEKYPLLIFVGIPILFLFGSLLTNGIRSAIAARDQFLNDGVRVVGKVIRYSDGTFTGSEMHWIEFEFVLQGSDEIVRTKAYFAEGFFVSWDRKRHVVGNDIEIAYLNGHPKVARPVESISSFA
jgi:hypothetical protein